MSSTVSFTVAAFYETGRLKASLQCQTLLGSIIWWNYWEGDLVKRLVTRWRADGARVWSRDCYLVHHNPLLQFLLLLLLFSSFPSSFSSSSFLLDKLELLINWNCQQVLFVNNKLPRGSDVTRSEQIRTDQNRCDQIKLTRDLAAQSTGCSRIIRPGP